jgi:hypothetical protein
MSKMGFLKEALCKKSSETDLEHNGLKMGIS